MAPVTAHRSGSRRLRQRARILARDNHQCVYCGRRPPQAVLELDHVIPRSRGGSDEDENLVTSCSACNNGKGDVLLAPPPRPCAFNRHPGPYRVEAGDLICPTCGFVIAELGVGA